MIYISISGKSLELIQTSKKLFDKEEKITAVSRKTFEKDESISSVLSQALKTSYPQPISQHEASLVIPDSELVIKRIENSDGKIDNQNVIEKAKSLLPSDITNYENFYKEIKGQTQTYILYTALPLTVIKYYGEILENCKLKLSFLSSTAFSIYALLKPVITGTEKLIYATSEHNLKLILMDSEGPIEIIEKKSTIKTFLADLKAQIKKIKNENDSPFKLIIGSEKSLEINTQELSEELGISVKKISTALDDLLISQKINMDTGGVPTFYFDKVIGLLNLSKMTEVPNFAVDLKNIMASQVMTTNIPTIKPNPHEEIKEIEETYESSKMAPSPKETVAQSQPLVKMEVEEEKTSEPDGQSSPLSENLVEYKQGGFGSFAKNRFFLLILFAAVFLILFISLLIIGGSNINLPFMVKPTPTPTVIPSPTITPTPTVDPSLERGDLKLSVLNGTDKTGFARENADKLEDLGYENITVGNANNKDYQNTVIRIKDSKKQYLPLLTSDLKESYAAPTVETLSEDDDSDAVIILGQK